MNKTKLILLLVVFAALGYVVGNFLPFGSTPSESIEGETVLEVTVVTGQGDPVENLEVDVAKKAGFPPIGGTASTDIAGIAVFYIKPGTYFIFFNSSNFPEDLTYPETTSIEVVDGVINKQTIVLSVK